MVICIGYLNASVVYHIDLRVAGRVSLLAPFLGTGSEWFKVCGQCESSLEKPPFSICQMRFLKGA